MAYYLPRCHARIRVPVMGSISERIGQSTDRTVVEFPCNVVKARISRNDFNQADEATLEVTYDQIGVDTRLLSNAIIYIWLGTSPAAAKWQPVDSDLRFVGIVGQPERSFSQEKRMMSLKAVDYTTLFLSMKPYPQATGLPKFTQTLRQAWTTVCDHTGFYDFSTSSGNIVSNVSDLRTRIKGYPDDSILDQTLGSSVLSRISQFGVLQVPHEADAWAVWRACTDSLGLLTWIYLDTCYVSQAPDYYSSQNPAVFTYGTNTKDATESRDTANVNGKGIHLTCFDPLTSKTLESFFPERNDSRVVKKRLRATAKAGSTDGLAPVTDYEHQVYPYPCTQQALNTVAERVWEERSRQELEGKLTTTEFVVKAKDNSLVDVLNINHGDQIIVKLDDIALDEMRKLPTVFARSYYLLGRGFSAATASLIARDQGYLSNLLSTFVVKENTVDFDAEAESLSMELTYCSRINPNTGSADEGEAAAAINRQRTLDQLEASDEVEQAMLGFSPPNNI